MMPKEETALSMSVKDKNWPLLREKASSKNIFLDIARV
jgi:hypothetical protein